MCISMVIMKAGVIYKNDRARAVLRADVDAP